MAKPAPERVFEAVADAVRSEVWDPGHVMLDMRLPSAERGVVDGALAPHGFALVDVAVVHTWSKVQHQVTVIKQAERPVTYLLHLDYRVVDKPTQANIDAVSRIPQLLPKGSTMRIFTGQVNPHLSFVRMLSAWHTSGLDAQFVLGRNLIDFAETGGDVETLWTVLGFPAPPVAGARAQPAAAAPEQEAELEAPAADEPISAGPSVFVSYSHKDTEVFDRLQVHLKGLVHSDADIDIWTDERIAPSDNWRTEISAALDATDFLVLLVSADFLASEFIKDEELTLLEKATERNLKVFWLKAQPGFVPKKITRFQALHMSPPLGTLGDNEMELALEQAIEKLANFLEDGD